MSLTPPFPSMQIKYQPLFFYLLRSHLIMIKWRDFQPKWRNPYKGDCFSIIKSLLVDHSNCSLGSRRKYYWCLAQNCKIFFGCTVYLYIFLMLLSQYGLFYIVALHILLRFCIGFANLFIDTKNKAKKFKRDNCACK